MLLLFISYLKARRILVAPCLCLPVAAAVGGQFWRTKSCGNPSLYLYPLFPRGGTGEDSDGMPLSSAADAMLGVCFRWSSSYVGISIVGLILLEAIFFQRTSKVREITTSTLLRQLILWYEDSVRDPQTLIPLKSWDSPLFYVSLVWGVKVTSLLTTFAQSYCFVLEYSFFADVKKER